MRPLRGVLASLGGRRDPAPSRLSYRWERLWLTPVFRAFCRVVLPILALTGAALWYLADEVRRDRVFGLYAEMREAIESRPEFQVKLMAIEGAGPLLQREIREVLPVSLPTTSFDLDLDALRTTVASLDAVASASVRIRPGGVLEISVTERVPVLVWRRRDGHVLLDVTGHTIARIPWRAVRADLPLVAGPGADRAVPEALAILAAAEPVIERVRGLERIGERRWDVVLDRGQRIMLPAENPAPALDRVLAMDAAQDLLKRDVVAVDLRLPARPTLRLSNRAIEALWQTRAVNENGGEEQ